MKNITVYNRASQRFPVLAMVNVDENHELTSRFGVRSIPTVKIFVNGTIIDEFIGALPNGHAHPFCSHRP